MALAFRACCQAGQHSGWSHACVPGAVPNGADTAPGESGLLHHAHLPGGDGSGWTFSHSTTQNSIAISAAARDNPERIAMMERSSRRRLRSSFVQFAEADGNKGSGCDEIRCSASLCLSALRGRFGECSKQCQTPSSPAHRLTPEPKAPNFPQIEQKCSNGAGGIWEMSFRTRYRRRQLYAHAGARSGRQSCDRRDGSIFDRQAVRCRSGSLAALRRRPTCCERPVMRATR
jgi:hypothetical protein